MNSRQHKDRGFTLVEVVITIIIAALVGTMVFTYLGNILARSAEPLEQVRDLAEAVEDMEEIATQYEEYLTRTINWAAFLATLPNQGVVNIRNTFGTGGNNADFDVMQVTITRNDQTVVSLFTERL